jgi:hypothetical protein
MKASRWILGCTVAALIAAPLAAFAGDVTTQDLGAIQHAPASSSIARPSDGGDSSGAAHGSDTTTAPGSDDSSGNGSVPVSTSSRQPTPHHSSVGWQSLLPGSIQ